MTRRVERARIERCEKTPHEQLRLSGWGVWTLFWESVKGDDGVGFLKRQDGQRFLQVEKISHMGHGPCWSLPPNETSDDRPTAAHVHT